MDALPARRGGKESGDDECCSECVSWHAGHRTAAGGYVSATNGRKCVSHRA
jgi:hypothetical protein